MKILLPLILVAAASAADQPAFEVASVKPNKSTDRPSSNVIMGPGDAFDPNGGYFTATNYPLVTYIVFAYKIMGNQQQFLRPQLPSWVTTERFDIQARAEGSPGKDEMRLMMRSLLAERFKFAIHHESREVPVLAMVLAKPDKFGPQLRLHPDGVPCPTKPSDAAGQAKTVEGGFPILCNGLFGLPISARGRLHVGGRDVTIAFIADSLSQPANLGRPMVDKTGIEGTVDFTLEWALATFWRESNSLTLVI